MWEVALCPKLLKGRRLLGFSMRLEGGSKSSKGGVPQLSHALEAERCHCPRGAKSGSRFAVLSLICFLSAWPCTGSGSDLRMGGVTPGRRVSPFGRAGYCAAQIPAP